MQGVIKAYDPATGDGLVMSDTDFNDYELAADALAGSLISELGCSNSTTPVRPPACASAPKSTCRPPAAERRPDVVVRPRGRHVAGTSPDS